MQTTPHTRLQRMTLCAFFAALTAVCSQIALPMPWGVPVNLALFAVCLAGSLLGPVWGAAAVVRSPSAPAWLGSMPSAATPRKDASLRMFM